jgi:hypothetical protein
LSPIGTILRRLRWRASRWSASADREFHDALFSPQQYDPFSYAYPGYLTIRRFGARVAAAPPPRRQPRRGSRVRPRRDHLRARADSSGAPADAAAHTAITCTLTLRNRSWRTLSSADAIFASYHWIDQKGVVVIQDGVRSPLPRPVEPGGECAMTLKVETPPAPGHYTLAVDLVEEGVTWFSDAGAPMLKRAVRVS